MIHSYGRIAAGTDSQRLFLCLHLEYMPNKSDAAGHSGLPASTLSRPMRDR